MPGALKSFHFSLGDSSTGPVGYCARIKAATQEEAVQILKRVIGSEAKIRPSGSDEDNSRVEYIEAYFNERAITVDDIDEEDDIEEEASE